MNSKGLSPNHSPILLAHIVVDFDWAVTPVQCIASITFGAGNPIIVPSFNVIIIRLKTCAFKALEFVIAIIKSASRL